LSWDRVDVLGLKSVLVDSNLCHISTLSSQHKLLAEDILLCLGLLLHLDYLAIRSNHILLHLLLFFKFLDTISITKGIQRVLAARVGWRYISNHSCL
jgi:hypothetical protein